VINSNPNIINTIIYMKFQQTLNKIRQSFFNTYENQMRGHAEKCSRDPKYRARTNTAEKFVLSTLACAWFADTYFAFRWAYHIHDNTNHHSLNDEPAEAKKSTVKP
jgi:hypothetical protein